LSFTAAAFSLHVEHLNLFEIATGLHSLRFGQLVPGQRAVDQEHLVRREPTRLGARLGQRKSQNPRGPFADPVLPHLW
jgi:hypothetical protein